MTGNPRTMLSRGLLLEVRVGRIVLSASSRLKRLVCGSLQPNRVTSPNAFLDNRVADDTTSTEISSRFFAAQLVSASTAKAVAASLMNLPTLDDSSRRLFRE